MNQALFPTSGSFTMHAARASGPPVSRRTSFSRTEAWADHDEAARQRRLRSLLGLFALYGAAFLVVVAVSDGADVGCILLGIAGHVLYATRRIVGSWREAAWLEHARVRGAARLRLRTA
jgi:hypothetical protein